MKHHIASLLSVPGPGGPPLAVLEPVPELPTPGENGDGGGVLGLPPVSGYGTRPSRFVEMDRLVLLTIGRTGNL